jgi:glycosyltransferase involved in cell wall biosynthesis
MVSDQMMSELIENNMQSQAPVTVVILTYNEEQNLPYALKSVAGWADQIAVADSYSTDATIEIARSYGAEVYQHPFQSYVEQRNWVLDNVPIEHKWVLVLDADELVSAELKKEIPPKLSDVPSDVGGFYIKRRYYFLGRWIKYGGMHQQLIRLFRRGRVQYTTSYGFREKLVVEGRVVDMEHHLVHEDRKGLDEWIIKQLRRAELDIDEMSQASRVHDSSRTKLSNVTTEERWKTWVGKHLWQKIPRFLRPFLLFSYRYFAKLGFLDGREGFVYHFLLQFWYPLIVFAKYEERKLLTEH